jgi:hypothetical protein
MEYTLLPYILIGGLAIIALLAYFLVYRYRNEPFE